jgi:multicomponent Na+:H+ antiporter subunit B
MHEVVIFRVVVRLLLPFILMYALYIQLHGEYSPGGGFQAGVIFAAGFIVYSFISDLASLKKIISLRVIRFFAAFGIIIYAAVGIIGMLLDGKFLEYSVLSSVPVNGQKLGIMLVELGVGITVFSVVMIVFYAFGERSGNDS